MIIAILAGVLVAGGAYLVMQRGMVRIIIGMTLISHAANLILLSTGVGAWRAEPLMQYSDAAEAADALPQAFVLTAIVITMAVTALMLALAGLGRDDETRVREDADANSLMTTAGRRAWDGYEGDSDDIENAPTPDGVTDTRGGGAR
ncbi:sodium:proton antiporter [Corynebacterium sp. 335C]